MSKPEQVLIIEPLNELRFRGPFTGSSVTSYIKLINPTEHIVYYKIKTTAPKRYCVRPNAGVLSPLKVVQIAVTLQPFDFDPAEKNKHKFMVQTLISDHEEEDYADVWKDVEITRVMESKLKCVFENPVADTTTAKTTATTTTTDTDANTTNNRKNKGTFDFTKSSPVTQVQGADETEGKLMIAVAKINQLRVEESSLRKENLQLREDILKLENAMKGNDNHFFATRSLTSQNSRELPPIYASVIVAIAVVMGIIGYVLGKMI